MSERNSQPTLDVLDQATEELRDAPIPAGPPAVLTTAAVAAINHRLAGAVPGELASRQRGRRVVRYIGYGSAVAFAGVFVLALAAGAGVMFFLPLPKSTAAVVFRMSGSGALLPNAAGADPPRLDLATYRQSQAALIKGRRTMSKALQVPGGR